jgi:DNA-binding response OmpR family regulator
MLGNGFDGTISKPFKIPIIMDRVRTLLREISIKATAKAKSKA